MEVHHKLPILECVVQQFFDHFAKKANDKIKLPIELQNITGTCLDQHVNDDCLLEIFTAKSLTLMDLCSLAETCKRFQQITQRVFPKQLSIDYNTNGYNVTSRNYPNSENQRSRDFQRILKNFGSILSTISISIPGSYSYCWPHNFANRSGEEERNIASHFLLNLIESHCANTLQFLSINSLKIWKLKLKRLRFLEIYGATIMGDKTIFADFESLTELRLIWVDNCHAILENVFPKLRRFTCKTLNSNLISRSLSTFFSRHKNLKAIDINVHSDSCVAIITQTIANSCTKLRELSVDMEVKRRATTASLPLQALKSLETLTLRSVSCENFEFVPALTELRELHLHWCDLPNDSHQFDFLTQLTKLYLHLDDNSTIDVVDVIIKRLINLEELGFSKLGYLSKMEFVLDEKTFSRIVGIVKERPKILTLKCRFYFNLKNYDNNGKVRLLPL